MSTSYFKLVTMAEVLLMGIVHAQIPAECLTTAVPEGDDQRGEAVSIDQSVAEVATPTTQFFGLEVCEETSSGRMVNLTFYLRDDADPDNLIEMPTIGPEVDPTLVTCARKRLQFDNYYVERVIIYETAIGIEAMRFEVPYKDTVIGETFGTPSADATEVVYNFSEETKLVSLSGYETYTGIGGLTLSSLD